MTSAGSRSSQLAAWPSHCLRPAPTDPSWPPSHLIDYSRFLPFTAGLPAISLSTAGSYRAQLASWSSHCPQLAPTEHSWPLGHLIVYSWLLLILACSVCSDTVGLLPSQWLQSAFSDLLLLTTSSCCPLLLIVYCQLLLVLKQLASWPSHCLLRAPTGLIR